MIDGEFAFFSDRPHALALLALSHSSKISNSRGLKKLERRAGYTELPHLYVVDCSLLSNLDCSFEFVIRNVMLHIEGLKDYVRCHHCVTQH